MGDPDFISQLTTAWQKGREVDSKCKTKRYIISHGNGVSTTISAAKKQAMELAKVEVAGLIESYVTELVENAVSNKQLTRHEGVAITKVITASKNMVFQKLGQVHVLFRAYREVGNDYVEVNLMMAYDSNNLREGAKQIILNELEKETDIVKDKLEKIIDFDNFNSNK